MRPKSTGLAASLTSQQVQPHKQNVRLILSPVGSSETKA